MKFKGKVTKEWYQKGYIDARNNHIAFAIDVVEQFGYESSNGFYYHDGGRSTLEAAFFTLYDAKVIKNINRVRKSEIKKWFKEQRG